jgi:uncharacterized protein YbaR (Trm112 family)
MKRKLLHLLACPADGRFPLELYVFEENNEVKTGVLFCTRCFRWYPINRKTPELLLDEHRIERDDLIFLWFWRDFLPKKIAITGHPCNLSHPHKGAAKYKQSNLMTRLKKTLQKARGT